MFFFVWFFVPETKGLSLEAMDDLFGLTSTEPKAMPETEHTEHTDAKNEVAETTLPRKTEHSV